MIMMKYLRILLCLSIVAFSATASVALADDPTDSVLPETGTIALSKGSDTTAKVCVDSKTCVTAPIKFGDGASWDNVHDNYTVSDEYISLIKAGKISITINSDGSASFNKINSDKGSSKKK